MRPEMSKKGIIIFLGMSNTRLERNILIILDNGFLPTYLPLCTPLGLERKIYWNNFQEHDFLRDLKFLPFFLCCCNREKGKKAKRAGYSKPVKIMFLKVVLISFPIYIGTSRIERLRDMMQFFAHKRSHLNPPSYRYVPNYLICF